MIQNPHLDALIARENYEEILAELRPRELSVVALRLDDLRYDQAAELLGLTRQGVYQRMKVARDRLQLQFPYLHTRLRGRDRLTRRAHTPPATEGGIHD